MASKPGPGPSGLPDQSAEVLRELADQLATDVARRYRIDAPKAVEFILEEWGHNPKLLAAVAEAGSAKEAQRTRMYRDAATLTKRAIYNRLRSYRAEPAAFDTALAGLAELSPGTAAEQVTAAARAVVEAHVSTAERLGHREAFLQILAAASGDARTVVDVGAGVLPAMIGADWLLARGIEQCWAVDKDAKAIGALDAYAAVVPRGLVRPVMWNIADAWDVLHEQGLPEMCDVAWLLKVVPVVLRQEPHLSSVLAATPARRLLISGSRVAMAKRQNIESRERRVLRRFCADYRLQELDGFVTEDEFFVLAERS
jgi:hypothetical protein